MSSHTTSGDDVSVFMPTPTNCDHCALPLGDTFHDCKTKSGPWATLCPDCFSAIGLGSGWGLGQLYRRSEDGRYRKASAARELATRVTSLAFGGLFFALAMYFLLALPGFI